MIPIEVLIETESGLHYWKVKANTSVAIQVAYLLRMGYRIIRWKYQ